MKPQEVFIQCWACEEDGECVECGGAGGWWMPVEETTEAATEEE